MTDSEVGRIAIRTFLEMMASLENVDRGHARLLLARGRHFIPMGLPSNYRRGIAKQCFANSQRIVMRSFAKTGMGGIRYAEGYACSGKLSVSLPIHHAWIVDENGQVIDPTWECPETSVYFGVTFETGFLRERLATFESYDSLLDDRRDGWSLLGSQEMQARVLA